MPKIYEYRGFSFLFYSNDHEPPHCHAKKGSDEIKAEFMDVGGAISIRYKKVKGAGEFTRHEKGIVDEFIREYRNEILSKWNIFFNEGKKPRFEKINALRKGNAKEGVEKGRSKKGKPQAGRAKKSDT